MSNVAFNTSYSLLLAESLYMFDACDKWKIEIREQWILAYLKQKGIKRKIKNPQ